jgi:hypothetical protein
VHHFGSHHVASVEVSAPHYERKSAQLAFQAKLIAKSDTVSLAEHASVPSRYAMALIGLVVPFTVATSAHFVMSELNATAKWLPDSTAATTP